MSEPLVNVIIPTHRGRDDFVHRILKCLQAQSCQVFDVTIVDNDFQKEAPPAFVSNSWSFGLKYLINLSDLGPLKNIEKALSLCQARYIKPIMSDDLIAPEFLQKTVAVMEKHPDINLAFTRRVFIDKGDAITGDTLFYRYAHRTSGRVRAGKLLRDTIKVLDWFPGEPSNFLLRNGVIRFRNLFLSPYTAQGLSYQGSFDLILYLKYLACGDAYFINEPLALIRQHEDRGLNESVLGPICHLDYFHFANDARRMGLINEVDYLHAACKVFRYIWYKMLNISNGDFRRVLYLLKYIENILAIMKRTIHTKGSRFERYFLETALESAETIISQRITEGLLSNDMKLVGYGTGGFARKLFEQEHPIAARISAFVDSDPAKSGTFLYERPIFFVDEIQKRTDQYILILSVFHRDIANILKKRGFRSIEDFYYFPFLG